MDFKNLRVILPEYGISGQLIKMSGYDLCGPYKGKSIVMRFFRKIWFSFNIPFEQIWYDKRNICLKKFIFVYSSQIRPRYMEWLKRHNGTSKIVLFYCDPIESISAVEPKYFSDFWCQKWTCDYKDAEKYGIHYYSGGGYFEAAQINKLEAPLYDVFYIGADKNRYDKLIDIKQNIESRGLKTYFHICSEKRMLFPNKKKYQSKIPYLQVLKYLGETKAILHLHSGCQNGYTLRIAESLIFEIKLITDDLNVLNEDYYSPNNVFVVGVDDYNNLPVFLNSPFVRTDSNFYKYPFLSDLFKYIFCENVDTELRGN